ncbi:MAG: 5-formyltetrahydrofolate cyclo-ligase [Desulfobulbaceae bacterium]|nr:5-formyltetrahydrofolate cyclo-ligase [Desulfobulbaceae bacterium]
MPPSIRADLRKKILAQRDRLPPAERSQKSKAIAERLWAIPAFAGSATLLIYVNFRSEVETLGLIKTCLQKGMRVCVPLTVMAEHQLLAYEINDPERDLVPGYCNIPEPDPQRLRLVEPAAIDTVILPGSVFDEQGGRLGYGGGYYDRFLQYHAPQALRIGVAYDLQLIEAVPVEPHDQQLHYLITESKTIYLGAEQR